MIKDGLGLSDEEACNRLDVFGYNELTEKKKTTVLDLFLKQFKSCLVYILIFAAALSFFVGEMINASVIVFIIFFIATLGFVQGYKAEKAIKALKSMLITRVCVTRGGKEKEITTRELVPGDMLTLRIGNKVPADAVVVADKNMKIDESMLTGESLSVTKTAIPTIDLEHIDEYLHTAEDASKIYAGTHIVNGKCAAIVTHTGMNTEFGKIAKMIQIADEKIPLQAKIEQLTKLMLFVALSISVSTFIICLSKTPALTYDILYGLAIVSIALAVSAIPEGLPVVTTIVLALGVQRMAKNNAIVRDMSAIETLGLTTIICTDKTGTLTVNEMTTTKIFMNDKLFDVSGGGYSSHGNIIYQDKKLSDEEKKYVYPLLKAGVLCNDAIIENAACNPNLSAKFKGSESSHGSGILYPLIKSEVDGTSKTHLKEYNIVGSPTEASLLVLASKENLFREDLLTQNIRIEEIPFSSDRKIMSVIYRKIPDQKKGAGHGSDFMYTKGAPGAIINRCSHIYKNGEIYELDKKEKKKLKSMSKSLGDGSLRVLALAYKKVESIEDFNPETEEENLVLLGLVGMIDPPRAEVNESIKECKKAGIKIMMITGDHKHTATTIGKELGIIDKNSRIITGKEIDDLTDEELRDVVNDISLCARSKPEHKLRLIKALEENNHIVTMTGDGVNDAPALKKAHVGIAMGTGSDVSKETADIILIDDHFSTIVKAVKEGRTIYSNIQKFITYQLSCNLAELFVVFFGVILFGPKALPLLALQILFMNLVTDDLPAIALGFDPSSKNIMQEPPRDPSEGLLNKRLITLLLVAGLVVGAGTLTVFYHEYKILDNGIEKARTMALATLISFELFNSLNFRSLKESIFIYRFKGNKRLLQGIIGSVSASLAVIYIPFLNKVFETVPIGAADWMKIILMSTSILFVIELLKIHFRNQESHL